MQGFLKLVVCILVFFVVPAATAIAEGRTIRVISDDNFPPYIFREGDGEAKGYLVDLWKLWEEKTGNSVELIATNWADAQKMLLAGQADIIDAIYQTPAREADYEFSPAYTQVPVAIFAHKSISGIVDAESLRGFQIGVQDGDACIDRLEQQGIRTLVRYRNYREMIAAARAQEVRLFCIDEYPGNYYLYRERAATEFVKAFELYRGQQGAPGRGRAGHGADQREGEGAAARKMAGQSD